MSPRRFSTVPQHVGGRAARRRIRAWRRHRPVTPLQGRRPGGPRAAPAGFAPLNQPAARSLASASETGTDDTEILPVQGCTTRWRRRHLHVRRVRSPAARQSNDRQRASRRRVSAPGRPRVGVCRRRPTRHVEGMNCIGPTARSASGRCPIRRRRCRHRWEDRVSAVGVSPLASIRPAPWFDSVRPMAASSSHRRPHFGCSSSRPAPSVVCVVRHGSEALDRALTEADHDRDEIEVAPCCNSVSVSVICGPTAAEVIGDLLLRGHRLEQLGVGLCSRLGRRPCDVFTFLGDDVHHGDAPDGVAR